MKTTGQIGRVEYDSNNSGGHWWLKDDDWKALESAGWKVRWNKARWLGALASAATREGLTLCAAVEEWERVTGKSSIDAGCACCGQPHSFTLYDDTGKFVTSGPTTSYEASW